MKNISFHPLLLAALFLLAACSDDVSVSTGNGEEPPTEEVAPDACHEKLRTQPYPKADNAIYLNPPPLIVPQSMKHDAKLQFTLSRNEGFSGVETILSEVHPWCMFNPHRTLEPGTWYWRFRSVSDTGEAGEWSATYSFEVKEEVPRLVTPAFDTFFENAPRVHPRLYCFLDDKIEAARASVTAHPEYKQLIAQATAALQADFSASAQPYSHTTDLRLNTDYLYQAYHLTLRREYADKMRRLLTDLLQSPPTDAQLFADNFGATDIASAFAHLYDALYAELSPAERAAAEAQLIRVARYYFPLHCTVEENHIFDNHFWQQNMRVLFQIVYLLYNKPDYSAETIDMMEYYYELWTARAPASGFNRDGVWHNGTGYFINNVQTLYYMPLLFSYVARKDFLQHPWYQNAGRSLVYTWPPQSRSLGFGDGSEKYDAPQRQRAAFADFLARETGNSYAGWYANECVSSLHRDVDLRLYRMASARSYDTHLPASAEKMIWYKDAGEVVMHSDLSHPDRNLSLAFRSSTFGSGSHTTACQNSFNLLYKGADVYRSSGYYLNFSDAHNLMSYRHTRAHNTVLVNGIGQPFSMKGYGNIARAVGGEHISYCMGDASHAYSGISDDPLWVSAFAEAGISQTPEYGFGATPLSKFYRHILMLHPDAVVIYDELEAGEPARWDWLLHSPTQFHIDGAQQMVTTLNKEKGFMAVAQLFASQPCHLSQTDAFVVPPTATPSVLYPNQWHLTAAFSSSSKNRILTVIQVAPTNGQVHPVLQKDGTFRFGGWTVKANLDCSLPAALSVTNDADGAAFSYGVESPVLGGKMYTRRVPYSSVLYDVIGGGKFQATEVGDYVPASTRAAF